MTAPESRAPREGRTGEARKKAEPSPELLAAFRTLLPEILEPAPPSVGDATPEAPYAPITDALEPIPWEPSAPPAALPPIPDGTDWEALLERIEENFGPISAPLVLQRCLEAFALGVTLRHVLDETLREEQPVPVRRRHMQRLRALTGKESTDEALDEVERLAALLASPSVVADAPHTTQRTDPMIETTLHTLLGLIVSRGPVVLWESDAGELCGTFGRVPDEGESGFPAGETLPDLVRAMAAAPATASCDEGAPSVVADAPDSLPAIHRACALIRRGMDGDKRLAPDQAAHFRAALTTLCEVLPDA